MGKDLIVYVLAHKMPPYGLINDGWHIPLQVGADLSEENVCELKDNIGINISKYNPFFCETTGHFWIWQNAEKSDFIGVEHYRRHFDLGKEEVLNILKDHDIIMPKPLLITVSVEEQYEICHIPEDIHAVEKIINKLYPEYSDDYVRYIKHGNKLYCANSYITSWENFMKMNEFVFNILFEMWKSYGFTTIEDWHRHALESNKQLVPEYHVKNGCDWDIYQLRIGGALAERLNTLYVLHNFNNIYERDFVTLGESV